MRPTKTLMIMAVMMVAAVALVAGPPTANALIHSPPNGATFQLADTIFFDWTWAADEYATAWIGFAHSPDGPWSPRPEVVYADIYGTPFLSSNASIPARSIGAGTWWWRVCNKSINIEDDKCQFGVDPPQQLTIAPAPASSLRITSGPPRSTTSTSATFTFDDVTRPGAMFDYRLDPDPGYSLWLLFASDPVGLWKGLDRGTLSFDYLSVGTHTLWLVSKDTFGQISNPVSYTWTIVAPSPPPQRRAPTKPKVIVPARPKITAHPASVTKSRSARFSMSDSTPGVTFKHSLDNPRVLKAGKRTAVYRNLRAGTHVFRAQAVKNGKASRIAVFIWRVKKFQRTPTRGEGALRGSG